MFLVPDKSLRALFFLGEIMKPWAEQFYKSKAWRDCRDAYFVSKFGLCEKCGRPGLIVHHKIKLNPQNINNPDITLNWDNLELLCLDCHNREHGGASTAEGLEFDENGDLRQV
jgi:5-methylcytosine-specific restriction endonuclease McrA